MHTTPRPHCSTFAVPQAHCRTVVNTASQAHSPSSQPHNPTVRQSNRPTAPQSHSRGPKIFRSHDPAFTVSVPRSHCRTVLRSHSHNPAVPQLHGPTVTQSQSQDSTGPRSRPPTSSIRSWMESVSSAESSSRPRSRRSCEGDTCGTCTQWVWGGGHRQ